MANTRRSWTKAEESVLIDAVKYVIKKGFKSENGFRAGFVTWVENAIAKEFPNTDLKTTQVTSKLTAWKKSYYSLTGILSRSGVGFNSKGNMIEIEDDQWDAVIKADPNAKKMRYKNWPYYEDWQVMFVKDRANGETAEDIVDAADEVMVEDQQTGDGIHVDDDVSLEDMGDNEGASDGISQSANRRASPIGQPKKMKLADEVAGIKDVLGEIGKKANERLAKLAEGIGYEAALGKARKEAFQVLGKIGSLSIDDRFDVCKILGKERDKLEIFMGLPDSALPLFVHRMLRNKGSEYASF